MFKFHCQNCGKEFDAPHRNDRVAKFCCHSCSCEFKRQRIDCACEQCGKHFQVHPSTIEQGKGKYCSSQCVHEAQKRRIARVCATCGKEFEVVPSQAKEDNYCSFDCWHAGRREIVKKVPSRKRNRVERTCQHCGKEFEIIPSWLKREGAGTFCSRDCANAHKKTVTGTNHPLYKKVKAICEWCGKEYTVKRVHKDKTRFCSQHCQGAYTSHFSSRKRTAIEIKVKAMLEQLDIDHMQEKPMGAFVCDFVIKSCRLVIECDGTYWHSIPKVKERDARKDSWLIAHGYRVLRLPESLIVNNPETCKQKIIKAINRRTE